MRKLVYIFLILAASAHSQMDRSFVPLVSPIDLDNSKEVILAPPRDAVSDLLWRHIYGTPYPGKIILPYILNSSDTCAPLSCPGMRFSNTGKYQIYAALKQKFSHNADSCNVPTCYPGMNQDDYQIYAAIKSINTSGGGGGSDTGAWKLSGNSVSGNRYLGTTNSYSFNIGTNNAPRMGFTANGHIILRAPFYDNSNILTINPNTRVLANSSGTTNLDWQNKNLSNLWKIDSGFFFNNSTTGANVAVWSNFITGTGYYIGSGDASTQGTSIAQAYNLWDASGATMYAQGAGGFNGRVTANGNAATLRHIGSLGSTTTANTHTAVSVTGSYTAFPGVIYGADYSANYTTRSLIDKGYATSTFAPISYTSAVLYGGNGIAVTTNTASLTQLSSSWKTGGFGIGINTGTVNPVGFLQTVETSTATTRGVIFDEYVNSTIGSKIILRKARGTFASPSAVQSADVLSNFTGSGYDGSNFQEAASMKISAAATPTAGVVPGKLVLQTANNSGTLTDAFTIDQNQQITVTNTITAGAVAVGGLTYTDTGIMESLQGSSNGYQQIIVQNSNSGAAASADVIVNNNNSTASTYYGDFGMNSSGFTGSGAFNQPNTVYLTATSGDLAIGTTTSNGIHFVVNGGTTDAAGITSAGTFTTTTASFGSNNLTVANTAYVDSKMTNPYIVGNATTTSTVAATISGSTSGSFTFTGVANAVYIVDVHLHSKCSGTGGSKYQVTVPGSSTLDLEVFGMTSGTTAYNRQVLTTSATLTTAFNTVASDGYIDIKGKIAMDGSGGTVSFGYSAGTSGETTTITALGSYCKISREQ